jgi:hypothetical protein
MAAALQRLGTTTSVTERTIIKPPVTLADRAAKSKNYFWPSDRKIDDRKMQRYIPVIHLSVNRRIASGR